MQLIKQLEEEFSVMKLVNLLFIARRGEQGM